MELRVQTHTNREVLDITDQVQKYVDRGTRAINVYVSHTTCAITTADLDPGTDEDLLHASWDMIPKRKYLHPHNPAHAPAHLASSIIGPAVTIPVRAGELILGTWQRIILMEFDGPRERTLVVTNL